MDTTYTGIDYGLGRSNIDTETGIRFGVISQHSIAPEAVGDCWTQGRDLTYETAVAEFKDKLHCIDNAEMLAELCDNYGVRVRDLEQPELMTAIELWDELEEKFNDAYSMSDNGDRDWLYERDGYKLTNCLQADVMVLKSPFYTYAQFCSPCVPGACNLDVPLINDVYAQKLGDNRAYCLGHDWFEGGQAPYPVYSVETGELVSPVAH